MQAKRKPMEEKDGAALGIDPAQAGASGAKVVVTEMTLPPERQAGKRFEGEPAETAAEVAQLLRSEAKVI
jgi:electron transfer flavoprotein beta subunit